MLTSVSAKLRMSFCALAALAALSAPLASAQQRLYRWVDEHGVVHFGDRIPPEFADRDRAVLNVHGVPIDREEGRVTDAERAALDQARAAEAAARAQRAEVARRDRMLLETYLSTADIERLRDSRLEMLASRVTVTEIYLDDLNDRLARLRADAGRYKPHSDRENAPQMPVELVREIARTEASIASYEQTLERMRIEQVELKSRFDSDIERFKQLKGG